MDFDDSVQTDTALILDIIFAMFVSKYINVNTPKCMFYTWMERVFIIFKVILADHWNKPICQWYQGAFNSLFGLKFLTSLKVLTWNQQQAQDSQVLFNDNMFDFWGIMGLGWLMDTARMCTTNQPIALAR